ncbi:MAG: NAD(P)H-hydrate dehydratase [Armatimonadetes bacterium]|nr:NAD(P)H-hydrate dehydratase [Armatimonadota bacterium]
MRVPSAAQMAALDRRAIEEFGIPGLDLMERAGIAVARLANVMRAGARRGPVIVLAGKGNNGGDGFVAARHLNAGGIETAVWLLGRPEEVKGDARAMLDRMAGAGIALHVVEDASDLRDRFASAVLIVDALFGTGFRGPARGAAAQAIEAANAAGPPILAVDVPSGVDADTGQVEGPCVRAAATVTMALPKVGLLIYPGAEHAGRVYVSDIGFPPAVLDDPAVQTFLVTPDTVRGALPARRPDSHKGHYGRVLVVAGSVGFAGAAALCALGALRMGAGLVHVAVPEPIYSVAASRVPEAMVHPLPWRDGALAPEAADALRVLLAGADAVAAGPGLGTTAGVVGALRSVLDGTAVPIVLDADALNILATHPDLRAGVRGPLIVTPHPGEMARLLGRDVRAVQRDRLAAVREAARALDAVSVLKGARTVVAAPSGGAWIVPTGNPGMATGGMGDALTGAVAALLGQRLAPAAAAAVGAYLHGLAGDMLQGEIGPAGLLASEVADRLPGALRRARETAPPVPVAEGIIPLL